jgi:hypothetical protein
VWEGRVSLPTGTAALLDVENGYLLSGSFLTVYASTVAFAKWMLRLTAGCAQRQDSRKSVSADQELCGASGVSALGLRRVARNS